MKKNNSISISPAPKASHTITHPAIATVQLLDQSPGAERVSGVTLYFEPVGTPSIELHTTPNVDASYSHAVAKGIRNSLDMTGLRIWWCDWLWHPINSSPIALTRAAEVAITQILPWLSPVAFTPDPATRPSKTNSPFPQNSFQQNPVRLSKTLPLHSPQPCRWTINTPFISHITKVQGARLFSSNRPLQNHFLTTQATLSFKPIANTQRPCPVDKLPTFHQENIDIFNTFANNIRTQIPNARGFDVMVQELLYKTEDDARSNQSRQVSCLAILTAALQQAINIRSKIC